MAKKEKEKEETPEAEKDFIDQALEAKKPEPVGAKKKETHDPNYSHLSERDLEIVTVNCDPPVKINGEKYEGHVKVPRHVADTIVPMIQNKRRSDLESITGKSYLVERLIDGTRIVKTTTGEK